MTLNDIFMYKNETGIDSEVLSLLCRKGKLSICEIRKMTHYRESHIIIALGSLIKDNRISILEEDDKIYIEPVYTSGIYY